MGCVLLTVGACIVLTVFLSILMVMSRAWRDSEMVIWFGAGQPLTAWLKQRAREGERVANPCHRLDRETSGVLLCAKTRAAESEVKTAFAVGRTEKTYLAVVRGRCHQLADEGLRRAPAAGRATAGRSSAARRTNLRATSPVAPTRTCGAF